MARYQGRVGGPLLDRIDLHVDVWRCDPASIIEGERSTCATSDVLREGVLEAREFASWRRAALGDGRALGTDDLLKACRLDEQAKGLLEMAARSMGMSGRGIARVLSVARIIADLEQCRDVDEKHLVEAIGFRVRKGS